jgi:hypothetical protein
MANAFIKAEQVLNQMLGVLERETVLANLVWRDIPAGAFRGAKNDTVSLRVPAYVNARTRTMRGGAAIVVDELDETKVDVTLDTHVYKAIGISDEEMTLDIVDFGQQVTAPAMNSVVRRVDDALATEMSAATPEVEVAMDEDDPYLGLVDARIALNNANVPASQRFLAVGSSVEAAILKSDRLSKFDQAGSDSALREASIGRIAGFTAVSVPGLDPDIAIAAHRTAFVLSLVAPVVPTGAAWGATMTHRGMSLRVLRDYDPTGSSGPVDRLLTDTFMGTGVTNDRGEIDEDGRFVPTEDGTDDPILVRAVKLTLGAASS